MKAIVTFLFLAVSVHAFAEEEYYCKLQNVPAVQEALAQALEQVGASQIPLKGEPQQIAVRHMGDAFSLLNTDLLVYGLDGIADNDVVSVGVKVKYEAVLAKQISENDPDAPAYICKDTHEVNAEIVYIVGGEERFIANPYLF